DQASQTLRGYVDGLFQNSTSAGKLWPSTLWYGFGATDSTNLGNGIGFNGIIDEVRVFSTARTQSQIQTDMNTPIGTGTPPPPPPPPPSAATPPVISSGMPTGAQPAGTTQVTMRVTTNINATCKYSSTAGLSYA